MRGTGIGLVASGMIAGIFIGSHMVGAIGASAPCGTATPAATTARPSATVKKPKVLLKVSGSAENLVQTDTQIWRVKGSFSVVYTSSIIDKDIPPQLLLTLNPKGQDAIPNTLLAAFIPKSAPHGTIIDHTDDCSPGCYLTIQVDNLKYTVTVVQ